MKSSGLVFGMLVFATFGCTPEPKSSEGFTLPVGQADHGQQAFVELKCHACHTVVGVEFEELENRELPMIPLGGVTPRVKTYGDLVTSIINPSHRFAKGYPDETIKIEDKSRMRIYNDEMTVTQLINLVAFLQSHYTVQAYQPTPYMPFY